MFQETVIRGLTFRPARFCAPMAGLTHCSFRRLAAEFGGCGAFFTEMLSAPRLLHEHPRRSPAIRRSPAEPRLICQLMAREGDPLAAAIDRLGAANPDGLDLNLACHAPLIRKARAGSRLYDDRPALQRVLDAVRRAWPGLLTVKIRLGHEAPAWEAVFAERLRLFEDSGVDAVILHPRFFEDKFKRRSRQERLAWAASLTRLPLIASGDITGPASVRSAAAALQSACAIMVGRMAIAQPWLFAAWDRPLAVDRAAVWFRLCDYLEADFPAPQALARLKIFTPYYARNFLFGHTLAVAVQNAASLAQARDRAGAFFQTAPPLAAEMTAKVFRAAIDQLARDRVLETIKPSVYYQGELIQMGEVIVGTPASPAGEREQDDHRHETGASSDWRAPAGAAGYGTEDGGDAHG